MSSPRKTIKISVVYMGRERDNNRDVKEFILQLQPKTRILNIFEYLHEIGKIKHIQVSVAMSKGGNRVPENFTIEQAKDLTRQKVEPLRFFMYDQSPTLAMPLSMEIATGEQGSFMTNGKDKDGSLIGLNQAGKESLADKKTAAAAGKGKQQTGDEKGCCCSVM